MHVIPPGLDLEEIHRFAISAGWSREDADELVEAFRIVRRGSDVTDEEMVEELFGPGGKPCRDR